MKGRRDGVVLFLLFVMGQAKAKDRTAIRVSDLLGYNKHGSSQPVIVIVNAPKTSQSLPGSDFDDLYITGDDGMTTDDEYVYEKEAKEQAKYLLYNYLNAPPNRLEISSEDPKPALRQALRARCQAVVECTSKCKPKKESYCQKSCKAVFDELNLCEAPKPKRDPCKKKTNDCNSRGRTMPPRWLK